MVEIFGFVVGAAAVDSHRRAGALRSCCEIASRDNGMRLDDCRRFRAQHRDVDVYDNDIVRSKIY